MNDPYQAYSQTYNQQYTNELIPVMAVNGPNEILVYDNLRDKNTRYIAPVYFTKQKRTSSNSVIFPEQYRSPAYFPYPNSNPFLNNNFPNFRYQ